MNMSDDDLSYLREACARNNLPEPVGPFTSNLLDGGRTGAEVIQLTSQNRQFILKKIPGYSWRQVGTKSPLSGEVALTKHDIIQQLPESILWPVIDVYEQSDVGFLLMKDVSTQIRGRGQYSLIDSHHLFDCIAEMHARFYQTEILESAPLPKCSGVTSLFTDPLLVFSKEEKPDWIKDFLQGFQLLPVFAPLFMDLIGPQMTDRYLELVADDHWKQQLDTLPHTLLHGDLRRANMAFDDEQIYLFDWELASKGPAGVDLQWHCFFHYWGYPPEGMTAGDECTPLKQHYLQCYQNHASTPIDPAEFEFGWQLGWIKIVAQFAYVLADPLYPDGGDANTRKRIKSLGEKAIRLALEYREKL